MNMSNYKHITGDAVNIVNGPITPDMREYARIRAKGMPARDALACARLSARVRMVSRAKYLPAGKSDAWELPITVNGQAATVRAWCEVDDCCDRPWERMDMLIAPVASRRHGDDMRVLGGDWAYNYRDAIAAARRAGCTDPVAAVAQEEDYLRRWLSDDWQFVVVCVEVETDEGETLAEDCLGGVESDYAAETAIEQVIPNVLADVERQMTREFDAMAKGV